jgi:hypothetical protein
MPLNRHGHWKPRNSHSGIVLDTDYCISVINHNAYLRAGLMVTEFANYNHNKKKHEFSLTISCFFVFMTATATYLRLPECFSSPPQHDTYIFPSMNIIRKVTPWQLSTFRRCLLAFDVFLARLQRACLCILTEFNRHWKLLSLSLSLFALLFILDVVEYYVRWTFHFTKRKPISLCYITIRLEVQRKHSTNETPFIRMRNHVLYPYKTR